jgi:hypothetical protein
MGVQPCILAAILGPAATEHGIESRASSDQERLVRRFTTVRRGIRTDPTVLLRQLPPLVIRRQSPPMSQGLTSSPGRLPRVQAAILPAIRFRVIVAVRRDDLLEVQIVSRPLFAVRHPLGGGGGGMRHHLVLPGNGAGANNSQPKHDWHRDNTNSNRPASPVRNSSSHEPPSTPHERFYIQRRSRAFGGSSFSMTKRPPTLLLGDSRSTRRR